MPAITLPCRRHIFLFFHKYRQPYKGYCCCEPFSSLWYLPSLMLWHSHPQPPDSEAAPTLTYTHTYPPLFTSCLYFVFYSKIYFFSFFTACLCTGSSGSFGTFIFTSFDTVSTVSSSIYSSVFSGRCRLFNTCSTTRLII